MYKIATPENLIDFDYHLYGNYSRIGLEMHYYFKTKIHLYKITSRHFGSHKEKEKTA